MICSKCGNEIIGKFCSNCGRSIVAESHDKARRGLGWSWLLVIGIILLVIILVRNADHDSGGNSSEVNPQSVQQTGNIAHDRLISLPEDQQMTVLSYALADEHCVANKVFYQGMSKDRTAFWCVGCTNGQNYQVGISADNKGTNRILDCETLQVLAGVKCFVKFKDQ